MSVFSERIKQLRDKEGISQAELAKKVGMTKSSINMYERGEREPGIDSIVTLSKFFGVGTDYLFGLEEDEKTEQDIPKKGCFLTDEEVEEEIERLSASEAVALARRKARLDYRRRQRLYNLRDLEKKGKALMKAGITREVLDALYAESEE